MQSILDFFKNLYSNKSIFIILFLTCVFLAIAIYYYRTIVQPKLNKKYIANKEFVEDDDQEQQVKKSATMYFFYTNWCPHCKNAKPEWQALQSEVNGTIKGKTIVFESVDCDKNTALADKFKVEGYPTIKLVYDNKIYDYDAKPNKETLLQFLNSVL